MERKAKIKYFQIKYFENHQVNVLNHVTHLNFLMIEKTSQDQVSLSTHTLLFTLSLLSGHIVLARKESQMHHILQF